VDSLARVAEQQKNSLRTAPFAMETAAELLCTGGYVSFPKFASKPKPTKIPMDKFEKLLRHKALLTDKADKVTQQVVGGLLELTRSDYYSAKLTLYSLKTTLVITELRWRLVDIEVFIIASIDKVSVINNLQSSLDSVVPSLAFVMLDQRLKQLFAAEMISRLHLQLKSLPHFASVIKNIDFKRGQSLKLAYWKDCFISIAVGETGVLVKASLPLKVADCEVFTELPGLVDRSAELNEVTQSAEVIIKKTLELSRLNVLTEVIKEYYSCLEGTVRLSDKLYFAIGANWRLSVDCCALSGQKLVFLDGEKSSDLTAWLEQGELFRRWEEVKLLALESHLVGVCKKIGASLSVNPLRFNHLYYSRLAEGEQKLSHDGAFVRYIELDTMVPSADTPDFHTFAIKLEGVSGGLSLCLVDFVNTTESIILQLGTWVDMPTREETLDERVMEAVTEGRRALMVKKLPLLLLAYPSC
jgi:hypothetical protein